jgi:DNA-binding winged helix-turn-helix (wHTH) protein/TolB-like protein
MFRFGLFEFDPVAGELRKQGRLVRIEPQPARALALLLAHAGSVITREQLRAHLWDDGTHVDFDRGLAYCIGQVRTALGDSAENPRFLETLPRRGYRFIAPVRSLANGPPDPAGPTAEVATAVPVTAHSDRDDAADSMTRAAGAASSLRSWPLMLLAALIAGGIAWTAWARIAPQRPLVAVAVFDNETGKDEYNGLAATAADIVVERLTALGPQQLGVIGNTRSLRVARSQRDPRAIRRETGAGYFVFGQVQDDDAGVRLVVHLIRLDDDTHLWVTRVARSPADLADIQDVVADRLAEAVRRHVIERDPSAPRFTR